MPRRKKRITKRRHGDVHVEPPMRRFIDGVVKADLEITHDEAHHAAEEFVRMHGRKPGHEDIPHIVDFALKEKKKKN